MTILIRIAALGFAGMSIMLTLFSFAERTLLASQVGIAGVTAAVLAVFLLQFERNISNRP